MGHQKVKVIVGKHTYGHKQIHKRCEVPNLQIHIGNFCSIANNCVCLIGVDHRTDHVSTFPFDCFNTWKTKEKIHPVSKGNIIIGNDVWIGENVTILSGVSIGDGAVIGANSVVGKNVSPYAIVTGNPAMVRKYRFTDYQISKLLLIKWWNWSDEKIQRNMNLIMNKDIDRFIKSHIKEQDGTNRDI